MAHNPFRGEALGPVSLPRYNAAGSPSRVEAKTSYFAYRDTTMTVAKITG